MNHCLRSHRCGEINFSLGTCRRQGCTVFSAVC